MTRASKLIWLGFVIVLGPRVAVAEVMQAGAAAPGGPGVAAACVPEPALGDDQGGVPGATLNSSAPDMPVKAGTRWGAPRRFKDLPLLERSAERVFKNQTRPRHHKQRGSGSIEADSFLRT